MIEKKIAFNTSDRIYLVNIGDILFCSSKNNTTIIYLRNQENIQVSKNIKELEEEISHFGFFRSHQSFLVNLSHIIHVDKKDEYKIHIQGDFTIPTSVRKRSELLKALTNLNELNERQPNKIRENQ